VQWFGPAFSLSLRAVPLTLRGRFAAYVRYDGALRFHDGTYDGVNAATGGIEWRW
jgi:hypothetical protein